MNPTIPEWMIERWSCLRCFHCFAPIKGAGGIRDYCLKCGTDPKVAILEYAINDSAEGVGLERWPSRPQFFYPQGLLKSKVTGGKPDGL